MESVVWDNIKSVVGINTVNGDSFEFIRRPERCGTEKCLHIKDAIIVDGTRLHIRLDFSDLDANGDPTLDVDMFFNGDKVKNGKFHNTKKVQISSGGEWLYCVNFDDYLTDLKFVMRVIYTKSVHFSLDAVIARPEEANQFKRF